MISRFIAAVAATMLLACAPGAIAAPLYTVTFLPAGFRGAQLNDVGQVVGTAGGAAALYSGGVVTTVAPFASTGEGINNHGDIMTDLNTLVDQLGGWELTRAQDINEAGQILSYACQNGSCTSVLLTPVPEPAAGLMLLAALALAPLAARRRRHTFHPSHLEA